MTTDRFIGTEVEYPPGTILMWEDTGDNPPSGWVFCDGNNGTPDLRGRYLKSVPDTATDPGATGGADSFTLSVSQIPAHAHSASGFSTDGSHSHSVMSQQQYCDDSFNDYSMPDGAGGHTRTTSTNGGHSHTLNTGNAGSGNSIDNRPATQTVTFIQKS